MRIRTLKPEFWTHPITGRLPPALQALAIGLLNLADDEGFFPADSMAINGALKPYQPVKNLPQLLQKLVIAEWIELKDHPAMGRIGKVRKFKEHQVINRPKPSALIRYWNDENVTAVAVQIHGKITAGREGKGREGKGEEGPPPPAVVKPKPKKAQAELPGLPPPPPRPPRERSENEKLYDKFQEVRAEVLATTGLDENDPNPVPNEVVPDEQHSPVFINTAVAAIRAELGGTHFEDIVEGYHRMSWAANCTPPFPFKGFASKKIFMELIADTRRQIALERKQREEGGAA